VERVGLVTPAPRSRRERARRLEQPDWAITYIAAILRRHADDYLRIAGFDISDDVGILCTLYHGGHSEARAARFAARRRRDPSARPQVADRMGLWVVANLDLVEEVLAGGQPRA
jgi:Protein of unknown function (DUF1402)